MKKLFAILFSLMLSMTAFAQYDVPNWNMETWDSTQQYMPKFWDIAMGGISHVKPAHGGNWACKLQNDSIQFNPGVLIDGNTDQGINWYGGKPYSQRPDTLRIFAKYNFVGNDSARLVLIFKKNRIPIITPINKAIIGGVHTSGFREIKIGINYLVSDNPDTVIIGVIASDYIAHPEGPFPAGNYMIIDDITFTGTGITQQIPNNGFEQWDSTMTYNLPGWYNENYSDKSGLPPSFVMTSDKCEGQHAVLIQNYVTSTDTVWGYITTRKPTNNDNGDHPSFKLTQPFNYNTLTFCYKYIPQNQDSMEVSFGFYKAGMGGIGGGQYYDGNTVNAYTERSMPLNFNPSQMPDSASMSLCAFVTKGNGNSKPKPKGNSQLYIDKLYFRQFPTIINNNPVICEGASVVLTVTGGVSYTWSTTETGSAITVTVPYTTTFNVTGEDGNGFTNQTSVVVTVNPAPNINVNSPTICAGSSAVLTASGASFYSWSNGLGAGNPKAVSPTANTMYFVTGTNSQGCTNEHQVNVNVNPSPQVMVNNEGVCPGISATLTASGANSYSWNTGTTSNPITVNPSVTTTYTVTGTSGNGCSNIAHGVVTVYDLPNVTVNQPTICPGNSAVLSASGASIYSWNNGFMGNPETVNPTVNTTYTVIGFDVNSCSNTAQAVVQVSSSIVVTVNSPTICSGTYATLTASGASTYTWGNLFEGGQLVDNPTSTTTYYVTGSAGAGAGCSNTAVAVVTVNPSPNVTSTGGSTICEGGSLNLHASGANTYTWSNTQTDNSITVNPTVTTTFMVTGANSFGCYDISSQVVVVNPKPDIITAGSTICLGSTATIVASGAILYSWNNGLGLGNPKTVSPTATTTYSVTCFDVNSCTNTGHAVVVVNSLPTITVNNPNIIQGNSTTLTASGGAIYNWSNGMNSNPITVNPTVNTTYIVTGTDGNGCTNTGISVVQVSVGVNEYFANNNLRIYPNPNNGNFILELNSANNDDVEIRITNLLGVMVYQEKNVAIKGGLTKEISLTDKSEGVYIVAVIGNEGIVNRTIIVRK
ncbi:MAG: T9SS type A sorting domain-containing protein [Bacteroidales bacterium]|jgi:hypothetical protein